MSKQVPISTKSIEVSVDGKVIGVFVPPEGESFAAMIGNIPRSYMRAQIMTGTELERWQWQLPDIQEGQVISFRMLSAQLGSGVPPHYVTKIDTEPGVRPSSSRKQASAKVKSAVKARHK